MGKSNSYSFTVRCAVDLTDLAEEESDSSSAPLGFESMVSTAQYFIGDVDTEFLTEEFDWEEVSYGTFHLPSSQELSEEWNGKGYDYSTHVFFSFEKVYVGTFSECWHEFKESYIAALEDFDNEEMYSFSLVDIYDPIDGKKFYPSGIEATELLTTAISELQKTLVGKRILSRYNDLEGNRDMIVENIDLFWGDLVLHFNDLKEPDVQTILKSIPKMKESKILGLDVPPSFELRDLPESLVETAPKGTARFCDQCGEKRKDETSKFCSSCGAEF